MGHSLPTLHWFNDTCNLKALPIQASRRFCGFPWRFGMNSRIRKRLAGRASMAAWACGAILTVLCGRGHAGTPATQPTELAADQPRDDESIYKYPQWAREPVPDWAK